MRYQSNQISLKHKLSLLTKVPESDKSFIKKILEKLIASAFPEVGHDKLVSSSNNSLKRNGNKLVVKLEFLDLINAQNFLLYYQRYAPHFVGNPKLNIETKILEFECQTFPFLEIIASPEQRHIVFMDSIAQKLSLNYDQDVLTGNTVEDFLVAQAFNDPNKHAERCCYRRDKDGRTTNFYIKMSSQHEHQELIDNLRHKFPDLITNFEHDTSFRDVYANIQNALRIGINSLEFLTYFTDIIKNTRTTSTNSYYMGRPQESFTPFISRHGNNHPLKFSGYYSDQEVEVEEEATKNPFKMVLITHERTANGKCTRWARRMGRTFEARGAEITVINVNDYIDSNDREHFVRNILSNCQLLAIPGEEFEHEESKENLRQFYTHFLQQASNRNIGIYGECAGMQRINQFLSIYPHDFRPLISDHVKQRHCWSPSEDKTHPIDIVEGSHLNKILGKREIITDTGHDRHISYNPKPMTTDHVLMGAWSKEGHPESIEVTRLGDTKPRMIGTQFHPSVAGRKHELPDASSHQAIIRYVCEELTKLSTQHLR
jgi:gamma-glutamyl-gamma-aminobutyrate hydrolase PuuD